MCSLRGLCGAVCADVHLVLFSLVRVACWGKGMEEGGSGETRWRRMGC